MILIPRNLPIVVVDDNEAERMILEIVLRDSHLANEVRFLKGGRDAIDYIDAMAGGQEASPALMLLDVNMPAVSGFQVLAHLRSAIDPAKQPIVAMLTSSEAPEDETRSMELGANTFLPKQSGLDEFIALFNECFCHELGSPPPRPAVASDRDVGPPSLRHV